MNKVDLEKASIIASYLSENVDNLHVTKLLKLFYYIDFVSYNMRGASVTGDTYYKLPYGPVPSLIKNEIDNLSEELMGKKVKSQFSNYLKLEKDSDKNGKIVKSKSGDYNIRKLSNFEINLLKEVSKEFNDSTAAKISRKTHNEKPYKMTSDNSVIDYNLSRFLDIKKILPNFSVSS